MSDELTRRVQKLEEGLNSIGGSISDLNTTIALLDQTVKVMAKNEEKRQQRADKGVLFIIGGFASAIVAWVVGGGLAS